jgi:hypothetical protein
MENKMKSKNIVVLASIAIFSILSSQAMAFEDEWSDYDPCGWNVEQEPEDEANTVASLEEDEWSDYDPCGWSVEEEEITSEVANTYKDEDEENAYLN